MNFLYSPKKSLGQNFLTDKNIIKKIIKIGNISKNKTILEIGPGYGNLTNYIIEKNPKQIFAIEKDKKLFLFLKNKFKNVDNFSVINEDILNFIGKRFFASGVTVLGNLPYNISTQILASLILLPKWPPWYETLILMFQKEVANRILAKTNSKEFGRLAVLCNWRLEIKKHFNISSNSFFPIPKVNSTILSFKPKRSFINLKNPYNLEMVTRILFSSRRKIIKKNLLKLFKNNISAVNELKIDLKKRPEELSCENFYKIAVKYENLFG